MRHVTAGAMMDRSFPRISADATLHEAVTTLVDDGGRTGVVIDDTGALLGTIGRREILRALSERTGRFYTEDELAFAHIRPESFDSEALRGVWREFWETPVQEVLRSPVLTAPPDQDLVTAAAALWDDPLRLIVIVKGRIPIGVVGIEQLLAALGPTAEQVRGKPNAPAAPEPSPV